jgi:hypothetical protein
MEKRTKVLLPLLQVLKSLTSEQRTIVLAHLDDKTRDFIYETITTVLRSEKLPFRKRAALKEKLSPYKNDLRYISDKKKSRAQKKNRLTQLGGGPMAHVLKTAIPMLLNLFPK